MTAQRRLMAVAISVTAALVASITVTLPGAGATDVVFDAPTSIAHLGTPLSFTLTGHGTVAGVELVTSIPGSTDTFVRAATVTDQGSGAFKATVEESDHVVPNSTFTFHFRTTASTGAEIDSPEATTTVTDDRFKWQTLDGPIVHLHWYEGDQSFAQRALDIGQKGIDTASALLGVTETQPVDFFVYSAEGPFRDALGPGTRENVGGEAIADIRTLFALIEPSEIDDSWVGIVIPHELTHLVFHTAIANPYHEPPRWLNEGLAVYLSAGDADSDKGAVESAVRSNEIIPLSGIAGQFPTSYERFSLAYSESVSAVDFFVRTYGKDELAALIRSYAAGVTDDEAFTTATGHDVEAFDAAWLASLGASTPKSYGPQPAPAGPSPAPLVP